MTEESSKHPMRCETCHNPVPERVLLCFGNYLECPIDEEECKVSGPCHDKAICDKKHDDEIAQAAREDEREKVLHIIELRLDEMKENHKLWDDGQEYAWYHQMLQNIANVRSPSIKPTEDVPAGIKNLVDQSFEEYKRDIAPRNRMKPKKDGA